MPRKKFVLVKSNIDILYEALGLADRSSKEVDFRLSDLVIVAIDFENPYNMRLHQRNRQLGFAILDTRQLYEIPSNNLISTYHFATGSPEYIQKASRRYLFGDTLPTLSTEFKAHIKALIPGDRDIVIVGHDIYNDLKALRGLKVDLSTRLCGILDTSEITRGEVIGSTCSLANLLQSLDCPHSGLHCAGNDANFTLRALLLLAVRCFAQQHNSCSVQLQRLAIIRQLALDGIPDLTMKMREKQLMARQERKLLPIDTERQMETRAARELRRSELVGMEEELARLEFLDLEQSALSGII